MSHHILAGHPSPCAPRVSLKCRQTRRQISEIYPRYFITHILGRYLQEMSNIRAKANPWAGTYCRFKVVLGYGTRPRALQHVFLFFVYQYSMVSPVPLIPDMAVLQALGQV